MVGVALACSALSSVALNVSWPCVASTDLYYVAVFGDAGAAANPAPKPLAIATASGCSTVLEDLVGGQSYWLRVRSHPSSAPATVWGWRPYEGDALRCATPAAPGLALERDGPPYPWAVGSFRRAIIIVCMGHHE